VYFGKDTSLQREKRRKHTSVKKRRSLKLRGSKTGIFTRAWNIPLGGLNPDEGRGTNLKVQPGSARSYRLRIHQPSAKLEDRRLLPLRTYGKKRKPNPGSTGPHDKSTGMLEPLNDFDKGEKTLYKKKKFRLLFEEQTISQGVKVTI